MVRKHKALVCLARRKITRHIFLAADILNFYNEIQNNLSTFAVVVGMEWVSTAWQKAVLQGSALAKNRAARREN